MGTPVSQFVSCTEEGTEVMAMHLNNCNLITVLLNYYKGSHIPS